MPATFKRLGWRASREATTSRSECRKILAAVAALPSSGAGVARQIALNYIERKGKLLETVEREMFECELLHIPVVRPARGLTRTRGMQPGAATRGCEIPDTGRTRGRVGDKRL